MPFMCVRHAISNPTFHIVNLAGSSALRADVHAIVTKSVICAATTTMKMGIERILKEQWPSLGDVVDIGGGEESVEPKELTIQTAHDALETIMPAIAGLGGSVRIVEAIAAESKIVLEYTGPEKIKFGIELALKDSPLIDTVEFL